ncbi:MAG: VWA domain-containing protein [Clostridiaceae bacterium]|nr:VWA domain-containing protein [Clostridiaceae bacterium]
MNSLFQIALVGMVTSILLLTIMFVRKFFTFRSILVCTYCVFITCFAGYFGISSQEDTLSIFPLWREAGISQSTNNLILANELILEGQYELSVFVLEDMGKSDTVRPESVLTQARLKALQGELKSAAVLYNKAAQLYSSNGIEGFPEDEFTFISVSNTQPSFSTDPAMISFLNHTGKDPLQYGFQTTAKQDGVVSHKEVSERILSSLDNELNIMKESEKVQTISRIGEMIGQVEEIYRDYLEGKTNQQNLVKLEKKLSAALAENTEMQGNKAARLALLKAMVLNGNYKGIAASVDEKASSEELMIVSELYMNGNIRSSDFNDSFSERYDLMYEAVLEQCGKVYDQVVPYESKRNRRIYKEKIESLIQAWNNKELTETRELLAEKIHATNPALESKEYLQLAKIENYLNNTDMADNYLDMAIGTASNCDDENYTRPMYELIGVISGSTEKSSDEMRNIAAYVDQVIDNSMPIPLVIPDSDIVQDVSSPQETERTEKTDFNQYFADLVTKKTAMINIGTIDKSNFPEMRARIQVSSGLISTTDEFLTHMQFKDCNSPVDNLSVERLEYTTSRIILLCDTSGSMSPNIQELNNAILQFADEMNANEEIAVVGFDSSIQFDTGFTSNASEVKAATAQIDDYGGTDMFSALLYAGSTFPDDVSANNIIILMTDGQDNNPKSEFTLYNDIGAMVADKAITVYTLGLGSSVDMNYLKTIAEVGNGGFIYVDKASSLQSFYDFIHQQLTNQYVISYQARNRTLNERTLTASIPEEITTARKKYYLVEPELDQGTEANMEMDLFDIDEAAVYGLSTKVVYKGSKDQTINLKGKGFREDSAVSVLLTGTINYDLKASFVDENTYSILIPNNLKPETYDVHVTLDTSTYSFEKELTIAVQGSERKLIFGDYTFTALHSNNNSSGDGVLSGLVTMNGWLNFKGDVVIRGDYQSSDRITVSDNNGAYISYKANNSAGLAKYMAEKGIPVSMAPLGDFMIYGEMYDPESFAEFPTDEIVDSSNINLLFMIIDNAYICLYPDMLYFKAFGLDLDLPFQEQILRNLPKRLEPYKLDASVDMNAGMAFTATNIGCNMDFTYSRNEDMSLVNLPLYLDEFETAIDTIHNNYSLELKVKMKAWPNMDSMGLGFEVKNGRFDGFTLFADRKVVLTTSPVPISMSDFSLGLAGFSEYPSDASTLKKALSTTIKAGFKMDFADASAVVPKLADFIGEDVSIATLDDCEMTIIPKNINLNFSSKLKLFTVLNVGSCEINMGKFSYSNELLGYNGISQYGLRASITLGSKWETANCYLDLNGTAELTLGYPYTGIYGNVGCDFDVRWWIFKKDFDVSGDLLIGVFKNSSDNLQFSMIVRGTNKKGKYSGFRLDITRIKGMKYSKY